MSHPESLDQVISSNKKRKRQLQAECVGGLLIDQFDFRRLLYRHVARSGTRQNLGHHDPALSPHLGEVGPIPK